MAYYLAIIFALIPGYGFLIMLLEKAKDDIKIRNDLLAFAYLIRDIGPSVSSVAVVGIVAVDDKKLDLFLVFILGLACSYFGRKLRDLIFVKTTKEKKLVKKMSTFAKEASHEVSKK